MDFIDFATVSGRLIDFTDTGTCIKKSDVPLIIQQWLLDIICGARQKVPTVSLFLGPVASPRWVAKQS